MGTSIRLGLAVLVAAVALLGPGCGGDDDEPESDSTTTEADSTASEDPEAAFPEPITAAEAETVKLDDRLAREIRFEDGPDWLLDAFGSLWMKEDDGTVHRLDPATGKLIAEVSAGPFKQPVCQGLGASDDAVWACPSGEGSIVRIDPKSNAIAATVRVDKLVNQGRLVAAADQLWVLTDAGNALTGIDLKTGKPSNPFSLPAACFDLAASGDTLWAACPLDDRLLQIDAAAAEVTAEVELPGATSASVAGNVFVSFDNGVAQVDPESLEVLAVYEVFPGATGGIHATEEAVWVREEQGSFLTKIDPSAQRIVEQIKAPEYPSGGDVVAIGDSVWATAADDGVLVGLRSR